MDKFWPGRILFYAFFIFIVIYLGEAVVGGMFRTLYAGLPDSTADAQEVHDGCMRNLVALQSDLERELEMTLYFATDRNEAVQQWEYWRGHDFQPRLRAAAKRCAEVAGGNQMQIAFDGLTTTLQAYSNLVVSYAEGGLGTAADLRRLIGTMAKERNPGSPNQVSP